MVKIRLILASLVLQSLQLKVQAEELWIVGGAGESGYVESFNPYEEVSIEVAGLGLPRNAVIGAVVDGEVLVCGGISGSGYRLKIHDTCLSTPVQQRYRAWNYAPSMQYNTSYAAHATFNNKVYVFGGNLSPRCGYRPQVQVFDGKRWDWSSSSNLDPPKDAGAYGCAVTYDNKIYVTGGYHSEDLYTTRCKEPQSPAQKTASNRNSANYIDYVQIFSPNSRNKWSQAPRMKNARRNHGCAVVNYKGEDGLMVVGGYNAQQGYLKSVEFLSFRAGSYWKELPQLQHARGNRVGVIEHGGTIYAVSGDNDGDGRLVETLSTSGGRWSTIRKKLLKGKSFASFITVSSYPAPY